MQRATSGCSALDASLTHGAGTLVSGLATSRPILLLLTTLLFLLLSLSFGQLIHHLLLSSPSVSRAVLSPSPKSPPGTGLYDEYDDWDDGPIIVVGGGGALIYDVVLGAIQTFAGVAQKFASSDTNFVDSLPNPIAIAVFGLVIRFLVGLAVLGSLSFLSLLLSLSLFAPLQIFNGFRGAGLFRRYTRRDGDGTGGTGLGQIMIIIFVLIGAANTLVRVYDGVKGLTRKVLMFVETQILEVNPDERRRAREKERKVEGWWARWVRERRFRSRRGWWEVVVRGWAERRRLVGVVWERMRGEEVGE
jgi:hypothetical protein